MTNGEPGGRGSISFSTAFRTTPSRFHDWPSDFSDALLGPEASPGVSLSSARADFGTSFQFPGGGPMQLPFGPHCEKPSGRPLQSVEERHPPHTRLVGSQRGCGGGQSVLTEHVWMILHKPADESQVRCCGNPKQS